MEHQHSDQEYSIHEEPKHGHDPHHHHDDECGCGHEHEHHHHHHHDDECGCGHEHEHDHHHHDDGAPYIVDGHTHEGASVGTGALTVTGIYAELEDAVKENLRELAGWVTDQGGIIGHIKSSMVSTHTTMLSITEDDVHVIAPQEEEMRINLAAIVFGVALEDLEKQVETICQKLLKIGRQETE